MQDIQKLKLIDGQFSPAEAKEILMNVFSSKINFHQMKNFHSQERFGREDKISAKRIPELKKCLEKVYKIIAEAETNSEAVVIKSEVDISFCKLESAEYVEEGATGKLV